MWLSHTIHLFQCQSQIRGICKTDKPKALGLPSALISNNLQSNNHPLYQTTLVTQIYLELQVTELSIRQKILTRAMLKVANRVNALVKTSSFTSFPKSPQKRRWSSASRVNKYRNRINFCYPISHFRIALVVKNTVTAIIG